MAAARDRGRRRRRRRRRRHRDGRHGDALLRGRRARPRRRHPRHRLAQPEGVHGHEDRPPRRAAGRRRLGPARRSRDRARSARLRPASGAGEVARARHLARVRRQGALVHRRRRDQAAARRHRRRERDGGRDAAAGARPAAAVDVVRCYFEPDGTFPNHEPNPLLPENREFIVAQDARGGRRPRRRVRRRRRPLLLRRRHGRVRPRRLRHGAARRVDAREGAGREDHLRRARQLGGARDGRGGRRHRRSSTASATRSSSTACARRTPSSAARSRATTTSATSPRPTRASSRSCSCSSCSRSAARSCRRSCAPFRERYFITGEINSPVDDVPLKLQELKERFGAEGGRVSHLDGLSVDFDDWHFNVRPSNTEPLLRLNLEALSRGAHGARARRGARGDPLT